MANIQQHWLDLKLSRAISLLIFIGALLLAATIHRNYDQKSTYPAHPTGNPEYADCMENRTKAIETMVAENIISNQKANLFQERAVALCSSQFPQP